MSIAIGSKPQAGFTSTDRFARADGVSDTPLPARAANAPDSLNVGKLAQALTGKAADLFNQMDNKARGALETLVNSGNLSAKDAVAGLAYLADSAEFQRYMEESPLTEAEAGRAAELEQLRAALPSPSGNTGYGDVREAVAKQKDALRAAFDAGQISEEEMQREWRAASMTMQKATEQHLAGVQQSLQTYTDKLTLQIDTVLSRKMGEYKAAEATSPAAGATEATEAAGAKAVEKLEAAGFSLPLYRDALRTYAQQADVPGLGRKAPAVANGTVSAPAQADITGNLAATPTEQAGLDLLRKAAGQGAGADGANDGQGFWAAKYLLSTMTKG